MGLVLSSPLTITTIKSANTSQQTEDAQMSLMVAMEVEVEVELQAEVELETEVKKRKPLDPTVPVAAVTHIPPMYTCCLVIIASPHMKSHLPSLADFHVLFFIFFFLSPYRERIFQSGRRRKTWAGVTPYRPQQMNSDVAEGEGKDGKGRSSFPSDCVTRTSELEPMVANKQSLCSASEVDTRSLVTLTICKRWANMEILDSHKL